MTMTKEEFKRRWESDEHGGGITNDDCADCYVDWGLGSTPRIKPIRQVVKAVCRAAGCETEEYHKYYFVFPEGHPLENHVQEVEAECQEDAETLMEDYYRVDWEDCFRDDDEEVKDDTLGSMPPERILKIDGHTYTGSQILGLLSDKPEEVDPEFETKAEETMAQLRKERERYFDGDDGDENAEPETPKKEQFKGLPQALTPARSLKVMLPCPVCGKQPVFVRRQQESDPEMGPGPGFTWYCAQVRCTCGIQTDEDDQGREEHDFEQQKRVIDKWNTRLGSHQKPELELHPPTDKQVAFAEKIAERLETELPYLWTKESLCEFIGKHVKRFHEIGEANKREYQRRRDHFWDSIEEDESVFIDPGEFC